jgi:predicted GNAT family N-acyltransferase
MTEHSMSLVLHARPATSQNIRHPLEQIDPERVGRKLALERADGETINRLLPVADKSMGGLAAPSVVHRVVAHNPDSMWAIARRAADGSVGPAEGFIACLYLTEQGLTALAARTLDARNPDLKLLTRPGERPAGIYIWAMYAPKTLAPAIALWFQKVSLPPYDDVRIYARGATEQGLHYMRTLGFKPAIQIDGIETPHLHIYERAKPKASNAPLYDTYRAGAERRTISVTVARTLDDWLRVSSIRSAVYIGEQECPFEEEFDGNDFTAIHLIGYVGDEPSGCIRIRHFADFAKIERLAVRKEFRNTRLSFQLVKAAIELCRAKGYRRLYGHSQRRLMKFWNRFGFVPLPGSKEFVFSDFDYVELVVDIEPSPDAIRIGIDPYVMIRPEGRWHEPGILERSASRPVSRPSVGLERR